MASSTYALCIDALAGRMWGNLTGAEHNIALLHARKRSVPQLNACLGPFQQHRRVGNAMRKHVASNACDFTGLVHIDLRKREPGQKPSHGRVEK